MNFGRRMRQLEQLKKQWHDSARLRGVQVYIGLGSDGLTLGARTVLAKRNPDGSLALDGNETKVFTLFSVAYGQALEPSVLKTIRRVSDSARDGDECKAAMYLALAKLPRISDPADTARRLFIADGLIAAGVAPRDIWKALDFDPAIFDSLTKYNQDQPRVPAGNGKPSGEWTSGGAANANSTAGLGALALAPAAARARQIVAEEAEAQTPRVLARLPSIALRLASIAARLNLPLAALIETLRASPAGGDRIVGGVRDHPSWQYSRYQDEVALGIIDTSSGRAIATLRPTRVRGQYADPETGAVAHMEGNELVLDAAPGVIARAQARSQEPDLCPEPPGLDKEGMIGPRGDRSRAYVNFMKPLINPERPTPPDYGYQLPNPMKGGKLVYYDDCHHPTGSMIDYKGLGFADPIVENRKPVMAGFADKWVKQANNQVDASNGRPIIWIFAEPEALEYARQVFNRPGNERLRRIVLTYGPWPVATEWKRSFVIAFDGPLPDCLVKKMSLSQFVERGVHA